MKLECESSHPRIDFGTELVEAQTLNQKQFETVIDNGEREAIDKAFDHAMFSLRRYKCKGDCEKRFSFNVGPRTVLKFPPEKVNGAIRHRALVLVDWTLDVECKHPKPGGGVHGGRPE